MIYFDNAASTRVSDRSANAVLKAMCEDYGNPSALYRFGMNSEKAIEEIRKRIGSLLGVKTTEIYFTPGATAGNNRILSSVLSRRDPGKVLLPKSEHASVHKTILNYAGSRAVEFIEVDEYGFVILEDLEKKLKDSTILVSIMQVNSELGTVQDIAKIGKLIKETNPKALFHVDGVQGFCKFPINLKTSMVDYYTMGGHKLHAPKGIGSIYVSDKVKINPVTFGGGQERGLIPGTENVPGIVGFGVAIEEAVNEHNAIEEHIKKLRARLIAGISAISEHRINSPIQNVSPYIINIGFKDIKSEVLLHSLDEDGICISSGSACGKNGRSRILEAIRLSDDYIDSSVRISFSKYNTEAEIDELVKSLIKNIAEIRSVIRRKR